MILIQKEISLVHIIANKDVKIEIIDNINIINIIVLIITIVFKFVFMLIKKYNPKLLYLGLFIILQV